MASMGKAPPPLRSRPPPDPPPCTFSPVSFESLNPTEPPEPPDPPDATCILVLIPFVDESHNPSPQTFSQVIDLESPASAMVFGSTSGEAHGVSMSTELSPTVRSTISPCSGVHDFSTLRLVSLGSVSCSDLKNLVLSMATRTQDLEYQLDLYLSNSAIRDLFVSLQEICVDMSVLIWLLAVLKPPSLQYAALRSLEDWTLNANTLVVECFVATALLNHYNSVAFHCLASDYGVHLAQNVLSVYRVHLAQSRDVMLALVSLFFQLSQASRVYTVSAPLLMKIRVQSRHKRPFPTTVSYGSGVTQLLLPDKCFQHCSIENLGRTSSMFRSVTSTLFEVKECSTTSVLVSIVGVKAALLRLMGCLAKASFSISTPAPFQTLMFGFINVESDNFKLVNASVLGKQVKNHLYGFLLFEQVSSFNISILCLLVLLLFILPSRIAAPVVIIISVPLVIV